MSVFFWAEHTSDEAKMNNNGNEEFDGQQQGAGEEPASEQQRRDEECMSEQQGTLSASKKSGTGPRTPAGKSRSKRNAVKHGFFSQAIVVLPHESQKELDDLVKGLRRTHKPKGWLEDLFVDEIAMIFWRYRRFVRAQFRDIDLGISGITDLSIRIETHLGRALDRALNQLKQAQDMRTHQSGVTQRSVSRSADELKDEVRLALAPPKA
jgi:hypothetical protein